MEPTAPVSVHLELPVDATLVRLARQVVSGVASTLGMLIDDVEACRSAVDELCSTLLEVADPAATLHLSITTDPEAGSLEATGDVHRASGREIDPLRGELSRMILASVVDSHEVDLDADVARFRFTKRADLAGFRSEGAG